MQGAVAREACVSDVPAVWLRRTARAASAAALVLVAIALVRLAWANWPSADDYCNCVLARLLGVDGALQWLYTQWSGRLVTGLPLYALAAILDVAHLRWISVAMAGGLVLAAWQIATFVDARERWWLWPVVLCVLVPGIYALLGQTVYWPTGAIVYGLPLLLLLHWLNGLRAAPAPGRRHVAYWFVVSVLLGNSIELVLPIAGCYLACAMWRWWRAAPDARPALVARGIGLACGFAILVAAPGNYLRANATPGSFNVDARFLADAYAGMLVTTLRTGMALFAGVIVLLAIAFVGRAVARTRLAADAATVSGRACEAGALALGGVLSLVPVLAAPAQFAPRNGLYLLVALLASALLLLLPVLRGAGGAARNIAALVALAAAVAIAVQLGADYDLASARRHEQLARDAGLRAGERFTERVVGPIRAPAPVTVHAVDIATDPGQIVNWCVAVYYELRSIRLDPAAAP